MKLKTLPSILAAITTFAGSCNGPRDEMSFRELFLGIHLGSDSADAARAAGRSGWTTDTTPRHMPSENIVFLPADSSGSLLIGLFSGHVNQIFRTWSFAPEDSAIAIHLHDSVRAILDRSFPRQETRHARFWIIEATGDSTMMMFELTRPFNEGDEYHLIANIWRDQRGGLR